MAHPNADLLRRVYEAAGTGDLQPLLDALADDVTWRDSSLGLLRSLLPGDPEVASLLALILLSYLASARADLLRRLGRIPEALVSYEQALAFTENEVERSFLAQRIADLKSPG